MVSPVQPTAQQNVLMTAFQEYMTKQQNDEDPVKRVLQVLEAKDSLREEIKPEEVEQLVVEANAAVTGSSYLNFKVSPNEPLVIEVVDGSTDEVLKVIPPEVLQQLYKAFTESDKVGKLLDEQV